MKLYLVCGAVALLGYAIAANGAVVLISTMLSFGLLIPVWMAVANLWWVWLLGLPVVVGAGTDRPLAGIVVGGLASALGYFGVVIWLQAGVQRDIAAFTPPGVMADAQPLAPRPARRVDIITDDQDFLAAGPCGALCMGLLHGGVEWLRVTDQSNPRNPQTYTFQRADVADCVAQDADFPVDAPCVLAATRAEQAAELTIKYLRDPGAFPGTNGFASLRVANRWQITDHRSDVILLDRTERHWTELVVPPHFTIDLRTDITHMQGVVLARVERSDPLIDPVAALQALGQPLAADTGRGDTALILSLLRATPYTLAPATQRQMQGWVQTLDPDQPFTTAEKLALTGLQQRGLPSMELERLMTAQPEQFGDGLAGFFRTAQTGNEDAAMKAMLVIRDIVQRDPPGTHVAHEAAYLELLHSGRHWRRAVQLAGRFSFDPAPVLRAELARHRQDAGDVFGPLMRAACFAGPDWDASLAPLVYEWMLPMVPQRLPQAYPETQIEFYMQDVGPVGSAALRRMGRPDLVDDLIRRVDWAAAIAQEQRRALDPVTIESVQRQFFGEAAPTPRC